MELMSPKQPMIFINVNKNLKILNLLCFQHLLIKVSDDKKYK